MRQKLGDIAALFAADAAIAVAPAAATSDGDRQDRSGNHIPGGDRQVAGTEPSAVV